MIEGIPLSLADVGGWGLSVLLVALVIVAIFRGWLSPKPHVDFLERRIEADADTIKTLTETNSVQARTIDKQTAVGDTVVKVMSSVQDAREGSEAT